MEVKFDVTISVFLSDISSEEETGHRLKEGVMSAFLYDVAGCARRFRVDRVDRNRATICGVCTGEEMFQLVAEMQNFFTEYGILNGVEEWEMKRKISEPDVHSITTPSDAHFKGASLSVSFDEEWAEAQETPPAPLFFKLLCESLGLEMDRPAENPSRLVLNTHAGILSCTMWDAGQTILKELEFLPHVVEFNISSLPEDEDEW